MFTGLIQGRGRLAARDALAKDMRFTLVTPTGFLDGVEIGASIAVNGVCLTVTRMDGNAFTADVSAATLAATTLGALVEGSMLNLERSLTPDSPMGGHMVSGHVDGVGHLVEHEPVGESWRMRFEVPVVLARYLARKGSVCVDGVSLTINAVEGGRFEVNIVPHTLALTNLSDLRSGDSVNIEVDLIARYVERLMEHK